MKKKYKLTIIMAIILSILYFDLIYLQSKNNVDLFGSILEQTNSEVIEYGVKASYITKENGEEACLKIFDKLNIKDCTDVSIIKNENQYCINFKDDFKSGYIKSTENGKFNDISINVVKLDSKNNLNILKDDINHVVENNEGDIRYYQYLKAKTFSSDISNINDEIINILNGVNSEEINTVKINNGYSTVANTKYYNPIETSGKDIDFNYAVCNYKSGNYIILGTPEIIVSY